MFELNFCTRAVCPSRRSNLSVAFLNDLSSLTNLEAAMSRSLPDKVKESVYVQVTDLVTSAPRVRIMSEALVVLCRALPLAGQMLSIADSSHAL